MALNSEEKDMLLAQRAFRMARAMMKAREEAYRAIENGETAPAAAKTERAERPKQGAAARQTSSAAQAPPKKVS